MFSIQRLVISALLQKAAGRRNGTMAVFLHLGTLGLFLFSILGSSLMPTFGGPDILIVILVATLPHPWWEFAAAATAGSVIGASITFRIGRRAGKAYLHSNLKKGRAGALLRFYGRSETGVLVASTAIPFPFPTGIFFAAAGASNRYTLRSFLTIVLLSRAVRYSAVALLAHYYGRGIARLLRHPAQNWHWLLLMAAAFLGLIAVAYRLTRTEPAASENKPGTTLGL
ncbi:MAG: YqaA family protein [Actinomycetota bacterium]